MMTCPQDLQVRYTESIAKYIWLEKVCSGCFHLPLDKSLDSVFWISHGGLLYISFSKQPC